MRTFRLVPVAALVAIVSACSSAPPEPEPLPWQELPVARCGMPAYTLLDPQSVGEVVSFDEQPMLDLTAPTLNDMLEGTLLSPLLPVEYGSRVFLLRYTTQDRGREVEATATVGVPAHAALPEGELPMMLYLHGTTGFSDPCAPGREVEGQAAAALMAALGFVVVVPDYIGLAAFGDPSEARHGYLVGEQVALASWDAVRAARKALAETNVEAIPSKQVSLWGASQGGHAALFADRFGPYYAPEFEVPGVVAAVPPSTLKPLVTEALTKWSPPTLGMLAVLTTMSEWYGRPELLSEVLTDDEPYRFASTARDEIFVEGECKPAKGYEALEKAEPAPSPWVVFKEEVMDDALAGRWDALEPWSCFLDENSLATTSVKPRRHTPTFMTYGEDDPLVVTAPMRDDFERLCEAGENLDFLECANAPHVEGAAWSLSEQLAWLRARIAGEQLPAGRCRVQAPVCCSGAPDGSC